MAVFSGKNPLKISLKITDFSKLAFFGKNDHLFCECYAFGCINHIFFYPRINGNCSCFMSTWKEGRYNNFNYKFEIQCYEGDAIKSQDFKQNQELALTSEWKEFISYDYILRNKNKFLLHDCLTVHIFLWGTLNSRTHFLTHSSSLKQIRCYSELNVKDKCSITWTIHGLIVNKTYENKFSFSNNSWCAMSLSCSTDDQCTVWIRKPKNEFYLKTKIYVHSQPSDFPEKQVFEYFEYDNNKEVIQIPQFSVGNKTTVNCYRSFYFEFKFCYLSRVSRCEYDFKCSNSKGRISSPDILQDFLTMFNEKEMTDVSLKVGDKVLQAHKFVLVSRSPVFKRMFEHDMSENKTNVINIEDISLETLNEFLLALYGAKIQDLNLEKAVELIMVAEKYQFSPLKRDCSEFLRSCMSETNFCEILSVSDMMSDKYLKMEAIEFFKNNSKILLNSSDWDTLSQSNNKLALEVLTACVKDK